MKHRHTNIILSLFSIPFVIKCAAKFLKIGLHIQGITVFKIFIWVGISAVIWSQISFYGDANT